MSQIIPYHSVGWWVKFFLVSLILALIGAMVNRVVLGDEGLLDG